MMTIGKGDPSGHELDILRFPLRSPEQLHSRRKERIIRVHLSSGNAPEVVREDLCVSFGRTPLLQGHLGSGERAG